MMERNSNAIALLAHNQMENKLASGTHQMESNCNAIALQAHNEHRWVPFTTPPRTAHTCT